MIPSGFRSSFRVGKREVGGEAPVFFIAEAGVAHFGDMDLARGLVTLAADARADAFKIQLFDAEALIAKRAGQWRERLRPRNLSLDQARELKELCEERDLLFLATAHDATRVAWLAALDVAAVKVGSGERNNPGFLTRLAALGKPMILSTGMYRETDVAEAVAACATGGCERLALLHCVTSYPAPAGEVNLAGMDRLRAIFPGPVGYSDHTAGGLAVLAAVARGARIVEKHITLLRDVPNAQDWKVSCGPEDFPSLVADVRCVEAMLGHGRKEPAPCEAGGENWALKSLVAARDLKAGRILAAEDLAAKRPGDGIPPNQIGRLLGRRLQRNLEADEPVAFEDVK